MAMNAPSSHQARPVKRGYSDPRRSPPTSHATTASPTIAHAHPGEPHHPYHHDNANAIAPRHDSYTPYGPSPVAQRDSDFTSYAKRRKTTSALSAPFQRPQVHSQNTSYTRPSPYPYPPASPSMGPGSRLTPLSSGSADSDSWQWSFFPDQRSEDRGGISRLATKSSTDLASAAARNTKQSSRHQRKRSAGCLNCHTIWSPTWRKDAQGLMRCNACGLYLAARGQERPITLIPKRKSNDEVVTLPKQPSPPREDSRYYSAAPRHSEDDYSSAPYYPGGQRPTIRPSPSFSVQSLGPPSSHSYSSGESRDMLSPRNPTGYSSSPLASPLSFGNLSLEPSRRLPYPGDNSLGLKNISRESSADSTLQTPDSADNSNVRISNTLPSPTSQYFDIAASRSPSFAAGGSKSIPRADDEASPRLMLPPLSELTRGLSSMRSDFRSGHRHYSISQDRLQTEKFATRC